MLTVLVDWDNTVTYSHPHADISADVLQATWTLGHTDPASPAVPPDGKLVLELDNRDQRYAPANTSSPLHTLLVPGRRVQIRLGVVPLWTGWLHQLDLAPGTNGAQTATVYAVGGLFFLAAFRPTLTPQLNQTADAHINALFQQVVASPAINQLNASPGRTVFPYVGDVWGETTSALRSIEQVVRAEQGWFWQARDGRFVFRDRHHFLLDTSPPQDADINTAATRATYAHGTNLATTVRITCYPRTLTNGVQPLWQSNDPLRVWPATQQTFLVRVDDTVSGALSLETPQANTDFTATDDFGRDRTNRVTVAATLDSGTLARVVVQNNAAVAINLALQLRGQGVTIFDAVTLEAENTTALQTYGRRLLALRVPLLDDPQDAQNLAAWLLHLQDTPQGGLQSITLHATDTPLDAPTITRMQNWTHGTRLTLSDAQTADAQPYLIVGEAGRFSPEDGLQLSYTLSRLDTTPYVIVDAQGALDAGWVGY